jgi:hypothetical protein
MKAQMIVFSMFFMLSACKTSVNIMETKKVTNLAVKSSKFRGTVFKENYPLAKLFVSDIDTLKRFTPTKQEIEQAEGILKGQISSVDKSLPKQHQNSPIIHKELNNYFRQYVGLVNSSNEKIIHVNFYWDKFSLKDKLKGYSDDRLRFEDDYAIVFDGGSRYWQINVNLTRKCLTDFQVNGIG